MSAKQNLLGRPQETTFTLIALQPEKAQQVFNGKHSLEPLKDASKLIAHNV